MGGRGPFPSGVETSSTARGGGGLGAGRQVPQSWAERCPRFGAPFLPVLGGARLMGCLGPHTVLRNGALFPRVTCLTALGHCPVVSVLRRLRVLEG